MVCSLLSANSETSFGKSSTGLAPATSRFAADLSSFFSFVSGFFDNGFPWDNVTAFLFFCDAGLCSNLLRTRGLLYTPAISSDSGILCLSYAIGDLCEALSSIECVSMGFHIRNDIDICSRLGPLSINSQNF